ncbi:MAG TPA: TetR/AcrR family transcriptional regulator [Methylophilaceae bacterium]|jgi:AcrR family transcriptional regulator
MPPRHKTEQQRQEIRNAIIDAAREMFIARGVEAVTMREIAKKVGYSPTALYLHFEDRDAILQAICDTDFLALANGMQAIMREPDLIKRINLLAQGYTQFALSHPNHYRLMFMTPRVCDPNASIMQKENTEQDAYAQLKLVVREAFAAHCFRPELTDAELIAQTLWAGIHGVCSLQIALANDTWVNWRNIEQRLHLMQQSLMRGLLRHS